MFNHLVGHFIRINFIIIRVVDFKDFWFCLFPNGWLTDIFRRGYNHQPGGIHHQWAGSPWSSFPCADFLVPWGNSLDNDIYKSGIILDSFVSTFDGISQFVVCCKMIGYGETIMDLLRSWLTCRPKCTTSYILGSYNSLRDYPYLPICIPGYGMISIRPTLGGTPTVFADSIDSCAITMR